MPTPEEIKAEIMSRVEELVDEALVSGQKALTLTQIEDLALGVGGKIEAEITSRLLQQQSRQSQPHIPPCPTCGERMHRKGMKTRYVQTRSGGMEVERPYFYCKTCRTGLFPLDEQLNLRYGSLSPKLVRDVVWLSALLPYQQAAQVLERIGGYTIAVTTLWEHSQQVGEQWAAQNEARHVGVERTQWACQVYQPRMRRSVSMDGGMVHVREEGWKELKVGVVGELRPPCQMEEHDIIRSHTLHYTAVLGGHEEFADALWHLAVDQRLPYAGQVVVTADGAPWIWRLTADLFPASTQIIDWYHASQHLTTLAQTRFPDAPIQAQTWLHTLKHHLWVGECWQVIEQARKVGLTSQVAYFEQHKHRMDYPAFCAEGFPVGSGTMESAVKQFKHRLCGAGMRWSRKGVRRMIPLRSAVMEGAFDCRWDAA